MGEFGYIVEVTNLSPQATEKDVYDFFSFSGAIDHIEIFRSGEYASTAYVTFKEAHALETAVLLSGATIIDQHVCIVRWGQQEDSFNIWDKPSWQQYEEDSYPMEVASRSDAFSSSPGGALTIAQDVVRTMLSKGYTLSKDTLIKAKAFDDSFQVSATAASKVSELSERIGLTDRIFAGVNAVKSVDQTYGVSQTTMSAASATGRTAMSAGKAVVNSSYFSAGALWLSNALARASQAAASMGDLSMDGIMRLACERSFRCHHLLWIGLEDAGLEAWAVDILGWGFSDLETLPSCDVAAKREHLYQFWSAYLKKPMILVGPSLGAAVAIDFASCHPEAVSKLILIDASVFAEGTGNLAKFPRMVAYAGVSVLKSAALRFYANTLIFKNISAPTNIDRMNVGRLHCRLPWWEDATVDFMLSGGYNVGAQIKKMKQRVLIIWGMEDRIIELSFALKLNAELPNSVLHQIPDCGHIPHIDRPESLTKLILDFI